MLLGGQKDSFLLAWWDRKGKGHKRDRKRYPYFPMGVVENQLNYLLHILCCLKHKGELSRERVQIPELTAAAHLPDCFTCCRVILFIIHVGKVSST